MSNPRLTALIGAIVALGAATIPRQLQLLDRALEPTGNPLRDGHHALIQAGLVRVIVVDRLIPPPTILLAGALLLLVAEPALALAQEHKDRIRAAVLLGLVPLVVQRVGELAVTWLADVPVHPAPGLALGLPQEFVSGPGLFWGAGEAPAWVEVVNARLNLVTLSCVGLWAAGLRALDQRPLGVWHVALPAACLVSAGVLTWWAGPLALALVLGPT